MSTAGNMAASSKSRKPVISWVLGSYITLRNAKSVGTRQGSRSAGGISSLLIILPRSFATDIASPHVEILEVRNCTPTVHSGSRIRISSCPGVEGSHRSFMTFSFAA